MLGVVVARLKVSSRRHAHQPPSSSEVLARRLQGSILWFAFARMWAALYEIPPSRVGGIVTKPFPDAIHLSHGRGVLRAVRGSARHQRRLR